MEHFVTLFDSNFLPQGLALYASMERHIKAYTLWILCVDDNVFHNLQELNLRHAKLLQLSKLETSKLLKVKAERNKGEYCWTLTPLTFKYVFKADKNIKRVTYIDADIWFIKSPKPIFDEFDASKKQVLITEHAYASKYDQTATSGRFCVQFLTISRNGGELVRKWWEDRCMEWCFDRLENGKFGDQKYLDKWPVMFPDLVHVMQEKEFALAPWNAIRFPYSSGIFWHFHGLRLNQNKRLVFGHSYQIPKNTYESIYLPYTDDFTHAISLMAKNKINIPIQVSNLLPRNFIKKVTKKIIRKLFFFYEFFFGKKIKFHD
jgi:hypothetical protein